jgi:acetate kinase
LAPLHNPGAISGIEAFMTVLRGVKNVTCFDTSFHQSIPEKNFMYPIPLELSKQHSIRKYGFHGISYQYITEKMQSILGKGNVNLIVCHIGNGASICAISNNKSIDTTMGLTPLAGLIMGTRSGDIDPSIHKYLATMLKKDINEVEKIFTSQSGLKGITGSSDMRDIQNKFIEGNKEAVLAINL